ncbi:MAG: transferase [Gammaproteobacteria bacterium]|nr:transferase [Gammaproteobacteria bacterium]|tara:strand:+ start:110 stop:781 length:672 start_codon:yes stop_codon:yes gene_type:complete
MKKIIIFGSGDHSKVILSEIIQIKDYEVLGFIDEYKAKDSIIETFDSKEYKVLGKINDLQNIFDHETYGIIGIGLNYLRLQVCEQISRIYTDMKWATIISSNSTINGSVKIGEGTIILSGSIINTGTLIGKHCIINTKSSIDHDNKINDYVSTGPGVITGGNVTIGKCSHLGIRSTINQQINIGNDTVVGANSLCIKNCDSNSVYYGSPAKKIKTRKIDENYL